MLKLEEVLTAIAFMYQESICLLLLFAYRSWFQKSINQPLLLPDSFSSYLHLDLTFYAT